MAVSNMSASLYDNRILIVDDMTINRELISSYLKSEGYRNIHTAVDGQDALEKIDEHEPDLLILDLVMPNVSGIEVIKTLRSHHKTRNLPILVQTMITDPEERKEAWGCGATDVIIKPIHKLELLSRVKVQLQNSYLIHMLEDYQKIASEEFTRALDFQMALLPSCAQLAELYQKYRLKIESMFLPSRFLSGDMWGVYEIASEKIMIWICDFSGKGIAASLSTFRLHTLFLEYRHKVTSPAELMVILNKSLKGLIPVGHFCTCLIGMLDLKNRTFTYAAAGSTHPIVYFPAEQKFYLGNGAGMPLGILQDATYEARTLDIPIGASLSLYSDLLWDDVGAIPGVSFLSEDLPNFIQELQGKSILDVIRNHVNLLGETSFSDDLTLIELSIENNVKEKML